jgi:hypothetical protein
MTEYTAESLVELIRNKYPVMVNGYNQNVVLEQVPDGTGYEQSRWIDVAVFRMWHQQGLTRSAFEIKVSRADFLNELAHPEKHQWCKVCFHEFWIVAPKDVVKEEELSAGVGWMYPRGSKLCIGRHAARNDNPRLDDSLLAAFMRAAFKETDRYQRNVHRSVVENDNSYKQAVMHEKAVKKFVKERGQGLFYPETEEDVYNALVTATLDKTLAQDRDNFLHLLDRFQRDVMSLMELYLVLAKKSLVLRDEYGKHVISGYGGYETEALSSLTEMMKSAKGFRKEEIKRKAELIDTLLSWDELNG